MKFNSKSTDRHGRLAGLIAAAVVASVAGGASAQTPAATSKPFVQPKISRSYADQLTKLPDWNGIWTFVGGLIFDQSTAYEPPDTAGAAGGLDFGPRAGSYEKPPYKPEVQKRYEEIIRKSLQEGAVADDVGDCKRPHGMPREMGGAPGPVEIIMLPGQVRMTWDWFNETRRIFTDGRPHPTGDDETRTYLGHSIGHWEGDTLVVDTVSMFGGVYDQSGAPYTDKVKLTERIHAVADGVLEDEMIIQDPDLLTKPWRVVRRMRRLPPDPKLVMGSYCEGNRVEIVDGAQVMRIPGEAATSDAAGGASQKR